MNTETGIETPERSTLRKVRDKGFTLIELIIVVVILGILTTVVVMAVGGLKTEAQSSVCRTDKEALTTAAEAYNAAKGSYAATEAALVTADFLKAESKMFDYTGSIASIAVQDPGKCVGVTITP